MSDVTHGLDHVGTGCPTCDAAGGRLAASGPRLATVKLQARGEDFRIVQLRGQLLVCAQQHGSCCCGWDEKGRMPFDPQALWGDEWERRKIRNRLHLTFTGCLGPCAVGNNALLVLHGRSIWLKDLNQPDLATAVYDWIESMLAAGRILPPAGRLKDHVYERFLPPPDNACEPAVKLRLKPSSADQGTASPRASSLLAQAPPLAMLVAALRVTPSPRLPAGSCG